MPRDCGIDEATLLEKIEFMCFPDLKNIIRLFATGAEVRRQPVQLELRAGGEKPRFSCEDRPNIPAERLSPSRRVPHWQRGGSAEHTSELQSLMRISYAVFCLKNK